MKSETSISNSLQALHPRLTDIEVYEFELQVGDLPLYGVGIQAKLAGREVFASAGGLIGERTQHSLRAQYEMLERADIVWDRAKTAAPAPSKSVQAKSNGVAFHQTFDQARQSAENECYERDRVLRAWLGVGQATLVLPTTQTPTAQLIQTHIGSTYEFRLVCFGSEPFVYGLFLIANTQHPTVFGFGCSTQEHEAIEKAANECLQRLCFLYDETIEDIEDIKGRNEIPSPQDHLSYWSCPEGATRTRAWLDSLEDEAARAPSSTQRTLPTEERFMNQTLTSSGHHAGITVRAESNRLLPLHFGAFDYEALLSPEQQTLARANGIFHPIP